MTELPVATWSGSFNVLGVDLKCHVLSNGTRIIEADSMHTLLVAMDSMPDLTTSDEMMALVRWAKSKSK